MKLADPFEANLRENVKGLALETLLGRAVVEFLKDRTRNALWTGTPNQLHDNLRNYWDFVCGGNHKITRRWTSIPAMHGAVRPVDRDDGVVEGKRHPHRKEPNSFRENHHHRRTGAFQPPVHAKPR